MTTHGAFTQAQKHAKKNKELGRKIQFNLKALFSTGKQLEEDADLTRRLASVNKLLKDVLPVMEEASAKSAALAKRYLDGRDIRKPYVLAMTRGHGTRIESYGPRSRSRGASEAARQT